MACITLQVSLTYVSDTAKPGDQLIPKQTADILQQALMDAIKTGADDRNMLAGERWGDDGDWRKDNLPSIRLTSVEIANDISNTIIEIPYESPYKDDWN